jgi:hypothetical protein
MQLKSIRPTDLLLWQAPICGDQTRSMEVVVSIGQTS